MVHVAICDSDCGMAHKLEDILLDIVEKKHIEIDADVYYNGEGLEKQVIAGCRYDIAFLEIQMTGKNGIEVAREIRKYDEKVLLVFGSASEKDLKKLFRLNVFSFLKKPYAECEVKRTFWEAYRRVCSRTYYFVCRYKKQEYKFACGDILYFESKRRKIEIHLEDGHVESFNGKLNEIESKLNRGMIPFLRAHQSYLVNFHSIIARSRTKIHLHNGEILPISSNRKKEFEQVYGELLKEESVAVI